MRVAGIVINYRTPDLIIQAVDALQAAQRDGWQDVALIEVPCNDWLGNGILLQLQQGRHFLCQGQAGS